MIFDPKTDPPTPAEAAEWEERERVGEERANREAPEGGGRLENDPGDQSVEPLEVKGGISCSLPCF